MTTSATAQLIPAVKLRPTEDPPFRLRAGQYAAVLVDPRTGEHVRTLAITTQRANQPSGLAYGRAIAAIHRAWESGQANCADEVVLYGADEGGQVSWYIAKG